MRWTTWTLFLAALALLVGVGAMVSRQSQVTPEEFLQEVEKRIADGRYDREQTLLNLDQVLARAREAGDADLEARVLRRRGRLSMELGAWDRARTDLLAVAEYRPGDPEVESNLIELETRAGDFTAAEKRVRLGLERDPGSPEAWTRLGRLHKLAADKHEDAAIELLSRVLAPDDLSSARASLRRSIALDPGDVARPAIAEGVRELLRGTDEEVLQEVLRSADRAAEATLQARDSYAHALEIRTQPEALAGLLQLFARAGRDDLVADLSLVALRDEAVRNDVEVARAMLSSLERLGRFRLASELARQWKGIPVGPEFIERLARIGLRADKWQLMCEAGKDLRGVGTSDVGAAANFYWGMGLVRNDQYDVGRNFLRQFVGSSAPDPIPGARALAWRAIAKASRALREPDFEREAIQGALELEPDFDGESHLRIAELLMVAPHGGYRVPETRFAKGMSLLPQRTEELFPRWEEIGRRELASIGFDPESVRADLSRGRIWTPKSDASPYELYRLAQIHHAAHDEARAAAHLDHLLTIVPGFLPALDLSIEVAQAQQSRPRILSAVAARIAAGGRTEVTESVLREVPLNELAPSDLHDLMRADPEYFGRIAAAATLARQGRLRAALSILETIEPATFGDEARVLAARLHLDAGQPDQAWALLEPIGRALVDAPEALELAVRAACWSEVEADVDPLLSLVGRAREVGRDLRLALADVALNAGKTPAALGLLRSIDSVPVARGGDVCTRLAIAAAAAGDQGAALRALARAEAFETHGGLDRAALTVAIHDGRAEAWKALAQRVAARTIPLDPLLEAALLVLQDRGDDAQALVTRAQSGDGLPDERWTLLACSLADHSGAALGVDRRLGVIPSVHLAEFAALLGTAQDSRAAAAWVALSAMPEGLPMALAVLRAHAATSGAIPAESVWPTWFLARFSAELGDFRAAQAGIGLVLAAAPDFEPAWNLRESLATELALDPVAYGLFRRERAVALQCDPAASDAPMSMQQREDLCRWLAATGQHAAAVAAGETGAEGEPPSSELTAIVGRSLLFLGRARDAVDHLARALSTKPPPRDVHGTVADLLAAVDAAEASETPLPRAESMQVLTRIAGRYPKDPRIVLAIARIDLEIDRRNPVLGVQRAIARLESYRAGLHERALDESEPGSAAAWIEFLARMDPDRALQLAEQELDLEPGSIPTWIAAAHVREAQGEREMAIAELKLAARIVDHGEVSREILRVRSSADFDAADIESSIADILRLEGRTEPDAALNVLAARAYLNLGPRVAFKALGLARAAFADPRANPRTRREAALLAALGLFARVRGTTLEEAPALLEAARPDPPSRIVDDFLRALKGLAHAPPAGT
jgi:tetratricopeptide (TPR) repeat protein